MIIIEGIFAEGLTADSGPDTNEVIAYAVSNGMKLVIPPKKNQKEQQEYGKEQYKLRHLAENAFLLLKRWRKIAFSRQEHVVISSGCPNFAASPSGAAFSAILCRQYLGCSKKLSAAQFLLAPPSKLDKLI